MISISTVVGLSVYTCWRAINIYQKYVYEEYKMTYGNVWDILFSLLMGYWLIVSSSLFLIAKVLEGIAALGLGVYINMLPVSDKQLDYRGKVVNGYWGYVMTDLSICVFCFILAALGAANG